MKINLNLKREIEFSEEVNIQGENKATEIIFEFPEKIAGIDINELNKYLIFNIDDIGPQLINNNRYLLTDIITQYNSLEAQLYIKRGKDLLFKSEIFELNFEDAIEVHQTITLDELDIIDNLITQYQEINEEYELALKNGSDTIKTLEKQVQDLDKLIRDAETARDNTEKTRVDNEEERNKSEETREKNESTRIENENERTKTFNKTIEKLDKEIDKIENKFSGINFSINEDGCLQVEIEGVDVNE